MNPARVSATGSGRRLSPFASTLMLAAVVTLPHLAAADGKPVAAAPGAKVVAAAPQRNQATFDLRIVGPDGKPIPEAKVELRSTPAFQAAQIRCGTVLKRMGFGTTIKSDIGGRIAFDRPVPLERLDIFITIPGYAPYWAGWNLKANSEPIPAELTAKLESAWTIGGFVVDGDGKPIPNARINFRIEFTKRPGDLRQMGIGDQRWTNNRGEWIFQSAPSSLDAVPVEINDPNFMTQRLTLSRALFRIEPGHSPAAKIVLQRGLVVTGKVTDELGRPIAKALVRTKFGNNLRTAFTGADGAYRLEGCEPGDARIVVSSKGRARALQQVQIVPKTPQVDSQMSPGGTIRIRVLDERGKPVPKATIFFQRWRGRIQYFEFDQVPRSTDDRGQWEWNEAPLDPLEADIGRPEGMQLSNQALVARDKEYVFRVSPALVVSGKVIDAETKQPIKNFRIVPGQGWPNAQLFWNANDGFTSTDGHYQLRKTDEAPAYLVRVEADGYLPGISRAIKSDEGKVTIDFDLKKGQDIVSTVLTADGAPAVRAKVALGAAGSQVMVENGDFSSQTYCPRQITDEAGRFHFGPQTADFWLVIIHPSGFAQFKCSRTSIPKTIPLKPWARVEGSFRVARKLQPNATIWINHQAGVFAGQKGPSIFVDYNQTTDANGRFVFDRVVPGEGWIGRQILVMVDTGTSEVTSSSMVPIKFTAGKTTHLDLGASGRPVLGQLQSAGAKPEVPWNFIMVQAAGNSRTFRATVDRDGNFCIDDVPPGDYSLSVQFLKPRPGGSRLDRQRFSVPAINEKLLERPVDLGVLTLQR
jgi:uncharacterized GH25 family protein